MKVKSTPLQAKTGGIFLRFAKHREGAGAIEFAIIFPLLVSLYLTSFELTMGFSVYKRATRAAGMISDIVSTQTKINKDYLATMKDVAAAIFVPYGTDGLKLRITGIQVDANQKATVAWSWDQAGGRPYSVGTPVDVPANLLSISNFVIHSELSVPHNLLMFMPTLVSENSTITIAKDYYFAKREGEPIVCGDC